MMRRRQPIWIFALLVGGCGARLALVGDSVPVNWGGNAGHTHRAVSVVTPPLKRAWSTGCEAAAGRALASDGQRLYVGLQNGKFEVLNLETGRRLHRQKVAFMGEVTTLASDERLWVVLRQGPDALQVWDPVHCKPLEKLDIGRAAVVGEPLLLKAGVALLDEAGGYRLYSSQGDLLAHRDLEAVCWAGPSASGDAVFCAAHDGRLWALSFSDASVLWTARLSGRVTASPAVLAGRLFLGSLDGLLHAQSTETGEALWSTDLGGGLFETVSVAGDTVYAGTARGAIAALSAENGRVLWRHETGSAAGTSPVISGKTLYLGLLDGRLLALDRETGEEQWHAKLKGRVRTTPLVVGPWLLVASEGQTVYGFRDETR